MTHTRHLLPGALASPSLLLMLTLQPATSPVPVEGPGSSKTEDSRSNLSWNQDPFLLKGLDRYLTLVEAQAGGRRYYKAFLADRLDGVWEPLADTLEKPFAGLANVRFEGERWASSFSHGELLRDGYDQSLTVDPSRLRFLYQGVSDREREGRSYGGIPWRLGLLER